MTDVTAPPQPIMLLRYSLFTLSKIKRQRASCPMAKSASPPIGAQPRPGSTPGLASRGARAPLSRFDPNVASHRSVSGGGERNRTDDLLLAKQALSQLSYTPGASLVAPGGRNGARTPRVSRPVQKKPRPCLPQRRILAPACASLGRWWAREDLNLRPHAYQARALTN
jgi:hypothetical protein